MNAYTISKLAEDAGISVHVVRDTLFEALAENMAFGMACENLARLEPNKDVPHIAAQGLMQALSNGWLIHL
ncbi:hypothetical protein BMS3Abin11_02130 [bacterium BMS3Abin11]|nr:hypothetical protein BMS3Abin11_02130 [bacterium BMS3Abin11]GMT41415.1 MAG: hypothetical protein IEMM0001_2150 [bacterium]